MFYCVILVPVCVCKVSYSVYVHAGHTILYVYAGHDI